MMSDEERVEAQEPVTELFMLATKLDAYGTFSNGTFDAFTQMHYTVMNQFLDAMCKAHVGYDMKLVVSEYQLATLLAVDHSAKVDDILSALQKLFQHAKFAFRVTRGSTKACVAFHCAHTTQIALNSTNDYKGGKVVFFDAITQDLYVLERHQGSMTHHGPRILHGVTNLSEGTSRSLFVMDRSNALDDDEVVVTNSQVHDFLSTYVTQTTSKAEGGSKDDIDALLRALTPLDPENVSRKAAEFMHRARQAAPKFGSCQEFLEFLREMSILVECPLLLTCMYEPVKTPGGHSFSREAITAWLETNSSCPLTRKSLFVGDLVRDDDLERIITLVFPELRPTFKTETETALFKIMFAFCVAATLVRHLAMNITLRRRRKQRKQKRCGYERSLFH
jgi:hypothetical protein